MTMRRKLGLSLLAAACAVYSFGYAWRGLLQRQWYRASGIQVTSQRSGMNWRTGYFQAQNLQISIPSDGQAWKTSQAHGKIHLTSLLRRKIEIPLLVLRGVDIPEEVGQRRVLPAYFDKQTPDPVTQSWFPEGTFLSNAPGPWMAKGSFPGVDSKAPELDASSFQAKWNAELQAIDVQSQTIQQRVAALQRSTPSLDNPLRDIDLLKRQIREAEEIGTVLVAMKRRLSLTGQQMEMDHVRLRDTWAHDSADGQFPNPPANWSTGRDHILRALVARVIERAQGWIAVGQASHALPSATPTDLRGVDADMAKWDATPAWKVGKLKWSGTAHIDSEPMAVQGVIEGLQRAATDGIPQSLRGKIVSLDRSTTIESVRSPSLDDSLDSYRIVSWKPASAFSVSNQQGCELTLEGEPIHTELIWSIRKDQWTCHVAMQQAQARLAMTCPVALEGGAIAVRATDWMVECPSWWLKADLSYDGHSSIRWEVNSNLAESIEQALEQAMVPAIVQRSQRVHEAAVSAFDCQSQSAVHKLVSELEQRVAWVDQTADTVRAELNRAMTMLQEENRQIRYARPGGATGKAR
jgi:hypothetical protein